MSQTDNDRQLILKFIKENKISVCNLARISKQLCSCGQCKFFEQHYTKSGEPVDWGHCTRTNIYHSKRVSNASCGYWEYGESEGDENE